VGEIALGIFILVVAGSAATAGLAIAALIGIAAVEWFKYRRN